MKRIRQWLATRRIPLMHRTFASFVLVVAVALVAVAVGISIVGANLILRAQEESMAKAVQQIGAVVQSAGRISPHGVGLNELIRAVEATSGSTLLVTDVAGRPVVGPDADAGLILFAAQEVVPSVLQNGPLVGTLNPKVENVPPALVLAQPLRVGNGTDMVIAFAPLTTLEPAIHRLWLAVGLTGFIGLGVAGAVAYFSTRSLTRPLKQLGQAAREIGNGDYARRVFLHRNDELADLAEEMNRMAEALAQASVRQRQYEEERSNFFANISHDLKTPLTAIAGYVEALREGVIGDDERQEAYLILDDQIERLRGMVDQILELARAESGVLQIHATRFRGAEVLRHVADTFRPTAEAKGLQLCTAVTPEAEDAEVETDEEKLEEMIENLVKNALQFTETGSITLRAHVEEQQLLLSIEDTGPGISPELLPHIWSRFFKVDPSRTRTTGESGLGLSIVKQLGELLKIRVSVESIEGTGSVFTLHVPLCTTLQKQDGAA